MEKLRRILVLTSGGDAPAMNAAVRAVVRAALKAGVTVFGSVEGYQGLIDDNIKVLDEASVSNIIGKGGTFLYTKRCKEFATEEGMQKALATCKKYEIDGIICVGGDGTFRGATDLAVHGMPTIGITGTIDNDITATDYTVGFDTAINSVVDMIDMLRDTAESHARCKVVEIMGRNCGQLAVMAAIAGGAIDVYIPEMPKDMSSAVNNINIARAHGKRGFVVAVSEGMPPVINDEGKKVAFGEELARYIEKETAIGTDVEAVETKFIRPAHIVRGGTPSARDRLTATKMGAYAVKLLLEGKSNLVVIEEDGKIGSKDIVFALTVDELNKGKITREQAQAKIGEDMMPELDRLLEKRRQEYEELCALAQLVCN